MKKIKNNELEINNKPYIIRGLVHDWNASKNWKFDNMKQFYGETDVNIYNLPAFSTTVGKKNHDLIKLSNILDKIRFNQSNYVDSYQFDINVTADIPTLKKDYNIPEIFNDRDYGGNVYLNLGRSKTGNQFISGGDYWSAIIFGSKRWFVYPPGLSPSQDYSPFVHIYDWYQTVYPLLTSLSNIPIQEGDIAVSYTDVDTGYRPFECIQKAGDMLFLPKGNLYLISLFDIYI